MKNTRIITLATLIYLFVLVLSGCNHPETSLGPIPIANWIKVDASINQKSYQVGEKVEITLSFQNISTEESLIEAFPPKVIITSSDKYGVNLREFPEGKQSFSLGAGKVTSHTLIWDQLNKNGQQVPTGKYSIIVGNIKIDNQQYLLSLNKSVEINIVSTGQ